MLTPGMARPHRSNLSDIFNSTYYQVPDIIVIIWAQKNMCNEEDALQRN